MVTYDQVRVGDYVCTQGVNTHGTAYGLIIDKHKGQIKIKWIHTPPYWENLRKLFGQKKLEWYKVNSYIKWKRVKESEVVLEIL